MLPLSLEAFDAESAAFDREALRTEGIDACCSSSDWVVPAHHAFDPGREPWIFRGEHGWLALACGLGPDGARVLQPLEPAWGLASPCVGRAPAALAAEVAQLLAARIEEWDVAVLTGLVVGGALWSELTRRLAGRYRLFRGGSVRRRQASLAGGLDGFLARRSANLRRSLVRASRAARARGIAIEEAAGTAEELYARVLAVEARSWKGRAGSGLLAEPMRGFYARMLRRLLARAGLRLSFARAEGRDVGYILGATFGQGYRGLQFSFDAGLAALGLGNALQLAEVEALCTRGVLLYDLGVEMEYKRRWAETILETSTLVVAR